MKMINIYKIIDEKYRDNLTLAEEKLQKAKNIEDLLNIKIDPLYNFKYSQKYDPLFLLNKQIIGTEREHVNFSDESPEKGLKMDDKIRFIIKNLENNIHKNAKELIDYNKYIANLNLIDLKELENITTYGIPSSYILPHLRIEDLLSRKD